MECRPKRRNRGEVRALAYGSSRHLPFLIYSNQNDNREIGGRAAAIDEINDFLRWNIGKEGSFPSIRGAARMLVEANARVHNRDSGESGDDNEILQSNNGPADF